MDPSPYDNATHTDRATYRHGTDRITYIPNGWTTPKDRPWACFSNGTARPVCAGSAIEAMRLMGEPRAERWAYTPGMEG